MRDLEISRYVVMNAEIREDGSVIVGSTSEAYPDAAWNAIARSFGKEVVLRAVRDSISLLRPRGEIYVVFFKPESRGNLVLIYGQQLEQEVPAKGGGPAIFLGELVSMPEMAGSKRPKYIRTTVYHTD